MRGELQSGSFGRVSSWLSYRRVSNTRARPRASISQQWPFRRLGFPFPALLCRSMLKEVTREVWSNPNLTSAVAMLPSGWRRMPPEGWPADPRLPCPCLDERFALRLASAPVVAFRGPRPLGNPQGGPARVEDQLHGKDATAVGNEGGFAPTSRTVATQCFATQEFGLGGSFTSLLDNRVCGNWSPATN